MSAFGVGLFAVAQPPSGFDELRLATGQRLAGSEVEGGVETAAAVEVALGPAALGPALGRPPHLLAGEEVGPLLGDPTAETRPRPQERFVDHGDLVAVDDQQPGAGQGRHHVWRPGRVDLADLAVGHPAAGVVTVGPQFDHPQQDPAGDRLAFVVERRQRLLGGGRRSPTAHRQRRGIRRA